MSSICLNCGAELSGRFCSSCGQDGKTSRYSFASFGREIYDQFKKIDLATTARTFISLIRNPGKYLREYLAGKRIGHISPIKYFFYSFLIQVLFSAVALWVTQDRTFTSGSKIDLRFELLALISTIFWGGLWRVFYRHSDLNLIENVVAAIYFVAQTNFITTLLQALMLPIKAIGAVPNNYLELLSLVIQIIYGYYFVRSLFAEHLVVLFIKQSVLTALYLVLVVVVFTLAAILGLAA